MRNPERIPTRAEKEKVQGEFLSIPLLAISVISQTIGARVNETLIRDLAKKVIADDPSGTEGHYRKTARGQVYDRLIQGRVIRALAERYEKNAKNDTTYGDRLRTTALKLQELAKEFPE